MSETQPILYQCGFCWKPQDKVFLLVAGPTNMICNECIDLCKDIMDQKRFVPFPNAALGEAEYRSWFPGKYL